MEMTYNSLWFVIVFVQTMKRMRAAVFKPYCVLESPVELVNTHDGSPPDFLFSDSLLGLEDLCL